MTVITAPVAGRVPLSAVIGPLETGSRPRGGATASGVISVGGEHLNGDGGFRFERPRYIPELFAARLTKGRIRPGDVLVVKDGATTGKVALVRDDFPFPDAYVNEHVFICRPLSHLDPRFLYHYLASPDGQRQILSDFRGAAQGGISRRFADLVQIPVAPRLEQEAIADTIEERLVLLDAGQVELKNARSKLSAYQRRSMEVTLDGHDRTREWPSLPLGDIAVVGTGSTPLRTRPEYWNDGTIPWVTSGQLNEEFVTVPAAHVTPLAAGESRLKLWPPHTLLVAMYGEGRTRGKCSELLITAATNQACAAIVLDPESPVRRQFLKLFLQSRYEIHRGMASGGVQPNLNLGVVRAWRVPVPPLGEQDQMIQTIAAASSVLSEVRKSVSASLVRADLLRNRVVSDAFAQIATH